MTDPNAMQDLIAQNFARQNDSAKGQAEPIDKPVLDLHQHQDKPDTSIDSSQSGILDMQDMKERLDGRRSAAESSQKTNVVAEKKLHPFVIAAIIFSLAALLASYEYLGAGQTPV